MIATNSSLVKSVTAELKSRKREIAPSARYAHTRF